MSGRGLGGNVLLRAGLCLWLILLLATDLTFAAAAETEMKPGPEIGLEPGLEIGLEPGPAPRGSAAASGAGPRMAMPASALPASPARTSGFVYLVSDSARACLNIHSSHLHAPLRGIFGLNSVSAARRASLIGAKSPTKCDAHLSESNVQTCSRSGRPEQRGEPSSLEDGQSAEDAMDSFDFQDIQDFIDGQKGETGWNLSFQEVMRDLMAGHLVQVFEKCLGALKNTLFSEIHNGGVLMGQIVLLGIFGAVFTNFSSVFNGSQISETGFFVTYLLLFTFLTASFFQSITIAANVVEKILEFMKILMPTYFLAVAFAGGSVSSVAMYEFTLWIITAAQWMIGSGLIPLVRVYMILVLAGHISKEEIISNLTELLEQMIGWSLKTLIGVVLGFHVIQGLVLPYVDSVKNSAVQKLIGLIPGIGQGASAVTQMILGSGVLIKNTMGMAAVIILLVILAVPVMKLAVLMVLYRCVAAVLEPVCDKRLVSCVLAAAKGHKLLLNMVMAAALLLIITVAVVCAGTNVSYYA